MRTAYFASLATLALSLAACSGTSNGSTTGGGATSGTGASSGTGGSGGATTGGAGAGGGDFTCPSPFVTKGPWTLAIDDTHAKIRWEACDPSALADVMYAKSGGDPQKATSTSTPITLTQTYKAPLNINAPPDAAGTYYTHEAALEKLDPGTCYTYWLASDMQRKGAFCTASPSKATIRFMAIGDTNPGLGHTAGVLQHVLPESPQFTVHGGDIEYYDSGLETWASWFPQMQPMLSQGGFFPAIGNHESEKSDELADYALRFFGGAGFDGGDTYYRIENAGVHFFSLNTQENIGQGSAQATWLEKELGIVSQQPGYRFSIVFFHRPLVTCGDTGDYPDVRAYLEPIFLANKVVMVLQAHMHGYERFEFDSGMTYVTTAGGGGLLGDVNGNKQRDYCDKRISSAAAYHAMIFDVLTGKLQGKAIDEKGTIIDTFTKVVP